MRQLNLLPSCYFVLYILVLIILAPLLPLVLHHDEILLVASH
jgi:hypothetical protein